MDYEEISYEELMQAWKILQIAFRNEVRKTVEEK